MVRFPVLTILTDNLRTLYAWSAHNDPACASLHLDLRIGALDTDPRPLLVLEKLSIDVKERHCLFFLYEPGFTNSSRSRWCQFLAV
jgi:hypothetical protein